MRRPAINPGLDLDLDLARGWVSPGVAGRMLWARLARAQPGWLRGQHLQRRTSQMVIARKAAAASVKSAVSIPWNAQNLLAGW